MRLTCRISSRSSAEMLTMPQRRGSVFTSLGTKYKVRTDTGPCMCSACIVPAGSHTAQCGGTSQLAASVSTRIAPDAA